MINIPIDFSVKSITLESTMDYIFILGIVGILVTLYAIGVERNARRNFTSLCDINDRMSCSRVLTSEYSRMAKYAFNLGDNHPLNVPNTYFGLLFYIAIVCYTCYPFTLIPFREFLLLMASMFSIMFCFYLAYVLKFVLHDVCIVCISTYIINGMLFGCALGEVGCGSWLVLFGCFYAMFITAVIY